MKQIKLLRNMYALLLMTMLFACSEEEQDKLSAEELIAKMTWTQQSCVKIELDETSIMFDPFMISEQENMDLVLISHGHGDHYKVDNYSKVANENTQFITFSDCELEGFTKQQKLIPGDSYQFSEDINIKAVPAYNIKKTNYHPKSNNWLGFVVEIKGVKVYFTGDTELIPEMKDIDCDIIMLPLGQVYTMNSVEEAVQAVKDTKAEIAIPVHFGLYEGTQQDADKFKVLLKEEAKVMFLERKLQ